MVAERRKEDRRKGDRRGTHMYCTACSCAFDEAGNIVDGYHCWEEDCPGFHHLIGGCVRSHHDPHTNAWVEGVDPVPDSERTLL